MRRKKVKEEAKEGRIKARKTRRREMKMTKETRKYEEKKGIYIRRN